MSDLAFAQVFSDHHLAVGEGGETVTVTVTAGDTVYWGDRQWQAAQNQGVLTTGQSTTITAAQIWLISASTSMVQIYGVPTVSGGGGVAVGSAVGGGTASSPLVTDGTTKVASGPLTSSMANGAALTVVAGNTDAAARTSKLLTRGGVVKVIYERLNALDGYLTYGSSADQGTAMQSFVNAVGAAVGGGGDGVIPAGLYKMGNTSINWYQGGCCRIEGEAGGGGHPYPSGTILQWETDIGSAPDVLPRPANGLLL